MVFYCSKSGVDLDIYNYLIVDDQALLWKPGHGAEFGSVWDGGAH